MTTSLTIQPRGSGSASTAGELQYTSDKMGSRGSPLDLQHALVLTDRVLALDEPWRSRFVELIAAQARSSMADDCSPSRAKLADWLTDRRIYRLVRLMVRTWTHEAETGAP